MDATNRSRDREPTAIDRAAGAAADSVARSRDWPAGVPHTREPRPRATRPGFAYESVTRNLDSGVFLRTIARSARRASTTSNALSASGSARG
ncbi:MAG: hypothetical protein LAQ69_39340 [Acidobacteriia bacterium]|nr:hypothetical protein [Terriglobia bacterium]